MKLIKYVTKYDTEDSKEGRVYNLSTKNLDDYILLVLKRDGWNVNIISPTITANNSGYYRKQIKKIDDEIKLILFRTFGGRTKFVKNLSKILSVIDLLLFLVFNTKRNEPIIVRHSLIFCLPVLFAKRIKSFKLILIFGEEYNKVQKGNILYQWLEPRIIRSADRYIFSNDMMGELYNIKPSKYTVLYGQYKFEDKGVKIKNENEKIHLVYAGIISSKEKSAFRAIELAKYLSNNYVIHILGNVEDEFKEMFFNMIDETNKNKDSCQVVFEGLKKGSEFIETMIQYDIGLNFRDADANYIDFAFPSKVLTYLSLGLRVVTSKIKCLEVSKISELLYYCYEKDPKKIAQTIENIDLSNHYNPIEILEKLDEKFQIELRNIILN